MHMPTNIRGAGAQLMHIDGEKIAAASGLTIDIIDPSTGTIIGTAPAGDLADANAAVAAARRSFESGVWHALPATQRQQILWRAADLLEQNAADLASLESLNAGLLAPLSRMMMSTAAETIRYFAGWVTKIHGISNALTTPMGQYHAYTSREPIGVAALIVPWNFPVPLAVAKLAAALAAGCSCVLKPSEETPFTALRLAEIFEAAGVPRGVINVVTGYGHTAGAALSAHPDVDKVAFTGSTEVGRLIVNAATGNLKKVTLELGGKSPVILFDDADLARAIPGVAMGIFVHSGQACVAGSRLYVQRRLFDQVMEGLSAAAQSLKIGSAFDPATQIGPLISSRQRDRVLGMVDRSVAEGATLIAGGGRVAGDGYYVQPTIVAHAKPDSEIMRQEVFGPVLAATVFDDFEEVVAAANDTQYGLASSIWTRDLSQAHRAARAIRAGFVWLNCQFVTDPSMPGGGFKQSGWGREFGAEGLDAYLQTKSVYAAL